MHILLIDKIVIIIIISIIILIIINMGKFAKYEWSF